jgi:hypothetical protein
MPWDDDLENVAECISIVRSKGQKDLLLFDGEVGPCEADARLCGKIEAVSRTVGCVKITASSISDQRTSANASQDAVMNS